ncbi:MAG: alanine--tRNA ligase [Bacteroidota bacterium]|jgi:alanyl-tRNA synthetase|nr:alanine--tRNA ligase [Cytophagales bacterium]MCZ8069029.1 alanine--tRNA ligase [Cytophagales bacterium]
MDSRQIRNKFLEFFESKGHKIVPSAPLVLKNDPTLLFTNSGMVQFKDNFLGNATPKYKRVADTQKCLRVSGKHNDLEDVGLDTYHHTMFEMLGNWSFGDYFKKDAIAWAWELLTDVYKLPKERLYVTVFGGDKKDNLPVDEEAIELWKQHVHADRILHGVKKDNFWEMGESGPCGPCSEIHIDLRTDEEIKKKPGKELVNNDHPQVVEIWNLVFIQFNRLASGALEPLPDKHVDTGMGFERLCMAIQGKTSNYDTDVFRPLMDFIALHADNYKYGSDTKKDIAVRVMADHIRAVAFAIADGQLPSNTGAGYVIRRILRRAVRYGFSYLNIKEPFMHRLVPLLALQLKEVFPELHQQLEYVGKVVHEEEVSFLRTLDKGLKLIENFDKQISGTQAFELYDTFGFPFDLTSLIARERGWTVDEKGFNEEMAKQKLRSKADAAKETGDWITVVEGEKPEFIGYDSFTSTSKILRYRKVKQKNKELFQLALDKTPFYAESGGQVGDTGKLQIGSEQIDVIDTKKENDLIVHWVEKLPTNLEGPVTATIDIAKRKLSMSNHSATHLLHAALRHVLGKHVEQKGSLVNDKILRFDFSHFAAMTAEEIAKVEALVNEKIRENIQLDEQRNVPIEKAKSLGAMALFGEKYGDFVRVITFDPKYSVELCGGTHVPFTGSIGMLKVISESSVAAGVRRIEAVTAAGAQEYFNQSLALLHEVKSLLKNPKDVATSLQNLVEEKHLLEKKLETMNAERAHQIKDQLAGKAQKTNGITVINQQVTVPSAESLKNIAYALRNQFDDLVMVLAANIDGKPNVTVMLGEKVEATKKFHAGNMVKELAKEIDGGGGGQPFYATAGGKNLSGLEQVIEKAKGMISTN